MRALQSERIFRIHEIIEARRVVSFNDLLAALEVSPATLKRDLAFLRDRLAAPLAYDADRGGYRYLGLPGPRLELLRPSYVELASALRRLVDVMERCDAEVPQDNRATDEEWTEALAAARQVLTSAGEQ